VYLFPGTIAENIAMRRGAHREDIARAARIAQMEHCASRWPRGYDTEVGDRGALLSAGERQLVAIARALVADPAVLVLDEATANVDAETERRVQDALERLMAGRTCILIAHRMSTAARCERVIVLYEGRIVEDGAPAELAARDGLFARMVRLQSATAAA
jgi:ATP-binding cassette subfamily B protein